MKTLFLPFICFLSTIIISSCDIFEKDTTNPTEQLSRIGFLGTMPADSIKLEGAYSTDNGYEVMGSPTTTGNGTFVARILTLDNISNNNRITLEVHLPFIQTENKFISFGEDTASSRKAKEYVDIKYPIDTLKKFLNPNTQNLLNKTDFWRVAIIYQKFYKVLYTEGDQTGSYLKVIYLAEGTENDAALGQLKTLDVIFELDLKMYDHESNKYVGNMKGFLRMKYRGKK